MAKVIDMASGGGERFSGAAAATPVSDELNRITTLLRNVCPPQTYISFSFDGRLQVHIDVRKREYVVFVEMTLPTLEPGLFDGISTGGTPRHPFYHRVSAVVHA